MAAVFIKRQPLAKTAFTLITWCQKRTFLQKVCLFRKVIGKDCFLHLSKNSVLEKGPVIQLSETFSTNTLNRDWSGDFQLPDAEFDWSYLCDPQNEEAIKENIKNRKGVGNIDKVIQLRKQFLQETDDGRRKEVWSDLLKAASLIPNISHPDVPIGDEENAKVVRLSGLKRDFPFPCKPAVEIGEKLGLLRTRNVVFSTGERTYYLIDELAQLEQALVKFTLKKLLQQNFTLVSVPDLLHPSIIEGCGFPTSGERTQVYSLDSSRHQQACLSGTAEMSLAGYFSGETLDAEDLPQKLCAVSRCYRAETSTVTEEQGLYRVHQFTKVEMFAVSQNDKGEESSEILDEFLQLQQQLYSELNLHYRVLNMPSQELGAPAYRKYDIETWMPANQMWGEISSASNCTDFQSRHLSIKYKDGDKAKHVHTINGTACAVPRMIIAILENGQNQDGSVDLPEALWPYMNGVKKLVNKTSNHPAIKWLKKIHRSGESR